MKVTSVWIVAHPQNAIIAGHDDGDGGKLAVFFRKKDAVAYKRTKMKGSFYRIYQAKVFREGDGPAEPKQPARLTPRAQAAVALAHKEADVQGDSYVGTEHLLLGMLKQQEGIAARHFIACGMSYEKAKYAIRVGRVS